MSLHLRNNLIFLLFVLIPTTSSAKSDRNAEAIVTLRDDRPCFSYPRKKKTSETRYSFGYLSVSEIGPYARGKWEISISDPYEKKGLLEPDSLGACIKYGITNPGMKAKQAAEPLQFNTPYRVHLIVDTMPKFVNEWRYGSDFCLSRNAKRETIIVGVDWDDKADAPRCLKPGEPPKRSIWKKLFRFLSW